MTLLFGPLKKPPAIAKPSFVKIVKTLHDPKMYMKCLVKISESERVLADAVYFNQLLLEQREKLHKRQLEAQKRKAEQQKHKAKEETRLSEDDEVHKKRKEIKQLEKEIKQKQNPNKKL